MRALCRAISPATTRLATERTLAESSRGTPTLPRRHTIRASTVASRQKQKSSISARWIPMAPAFWTSYAIPTMLGLNSVAAMMVLGACVYVVLNTGLVSLVIALAEGRPLRDLWSSCYEWTFTYFLVGAAVAGLASAASHGTNLGVALLVAPAMYLVHTYYRMHIVGAVLENISNVSQESEAVLAGASRGR